MDIAELLSRVGLAFGIGLLIGLERGWRRREERSGGRTAGVRTFAISGLLGGIAAALGRTAEGNLSIAGGIVLGSVFVAFAAVMALFNRDENRARQTFSATTTIAALLAFVLGAYALLGDMRIAAAAAVTATGILFIRDELHGWVAKITLPEFESGLVLLAMTFIGLPLVPNQPIGPFGGVNPREIWIIAIVLGAVSFAGYVAVKSLGERRGILLAAATGGVVSSTAVTLANARSALKGESAPRLLAAGTALASAVSFVRVAAIVAALKPTLLAFLAPALLMAALASVGSAVALVYWRTTDQQSLPAMELRNPFRFWSVSLMAASLGVLIVVGRVIYEQFGATGAIGGAAAMGLFDVDAMTISMARLAPSPLALPTAAYAILVGVAVNLATKVVIAAAIGRNGYALHTTLTALFSAVVGWITIWLTMSLVATTL